MKQLKLYKASEETFYSILEENEEWIEETNHIVDYEGGYSMSSFIKYNGYDKFIICECELNKYLVESNLPEATTTWKQCIVTKVMSQEKPLEKGITGGMAWKFMMQLLKNYYPTDDEIEECFAKHRRKHNDNLAQWHENRVDDFDCKYIYHYKNCRKYDINGAYASALIDIFPKAKKAILKLYNERKIKPVNKDYINYFVGCFCIHGQRGTYNYIVQKIHKQMAQAMLHCNGKLLYANTDGFAITDFENELSTSRELGDFKLEYSGDIYIYTGENYWIYQQATDKKITGNLLHTARKQVDLMNGLTVKYDRVPGEHVVHAKNIEQVKKEIKLGNGNKNNNN